MYLCGNSWGKILTVARILARIIREYSNKKYKHSLHPRNNAQFSSSSLSIACHISVFSTSESALNQTNLSSMKWGRPLAQQLQDAKCRSRYAPKARSASSLPFSEDEKMGSLSSMFRMQREGTPRLASHLSIDSLEDRISSGRASWTPSASTSPGVVPANAHRESYWLYSDHCLSVFQLTAALSKSFRLNEATLCALNINEATLCALNINEATLCALNINEATLCALNINEATLCALNINEATLCALNINEATLCALNINEATLCALNINEATLCALNIKAWSCA